jgi:hypothetical protein
MWTTCDPEAGRSSKTPIKTNPSLRRKPIDQILANRIDEEGGPLVYVLEAEEQLQRAFDSTCRKLTTSSYRRADPA